MIAKWCKWCGEDIHSPDKRRRYYNCWCAYEHQRSVYQEKLIARFDAGEELTSAQFNLIAAPMRRIPIS